MLAEEALKSKEFIYFDFETTGLDPKSDRICQIGAILPDGTELDVLINPEMKMPQTAFDCHGISDEMLKDAPLFAEYVELLVKALSDAKYFVAYNFAFDFQFLQYEIYRVTGQILKESDYIFVDPYLIFKKVFPHTLANAYRFYFGKDFHGNHNAMHDIRATKDVLFAQMDKNKDFFSQGLEKVESETLGRRSGILGKWFMTENSKVIFAQGKFKGQEVNVKEHSSYLKWIAGLEDITLSESIYIKELLTGIFKIT